MSFERLPQWRTTRIDQNIRPTTKAAALWQSTGRPYGGRQVSSLSKSPLACLQAIPAHTASLLPSYHIADRMEMKFRICGIWQPIFVEGKLNLDLISTGCPLSRHESSAVDYNRLFSSPGNDLTSGNFNFASALNRGGSDKIGKIVCGNGNLYHLFI